MARKPLKNLIDYHFKNVSAISQYMYNIKEKSSLYWEKMFKYEKCIF